MKFYKISEFADKIGVTSVTLRTWESKGWLKPHHKSPSGYRFYSEEQLYKYLNGEYIFGEEDQNGNSGYVTSKE